MKEKLFITFTALAGLGLFGSLMWTGISGNPMPFIVGYPVAFVCLMIAWLFQPKKQ